MHRPSAGRPPPSPRARGLGVALTCFVAQLLVAVPGLTTPRAGFAVQTWLFVVVPVALLATMVLWLTAVARGGGRAALWCAVGAAASLVVYRVGVTLPLAGAALVLGRSAPHDDPGHVRPGAWAMAVAAGVALVTAVLGARDALGW